MSYKDTDLKQVCPYNDFKECFYRECPFFVFVEKEKHVFQGFSSVADKCGVHRSIYTTETYTESIGCNRVQAEIEASKQNFTNNVNVGIDNKVVARSSIF